MGRAFNNWKMAYELIPSGLLPTLTRAIHRSSFVTEIIEEMSAGRRIFTLCMDELYTETPDT